MFRVVKNSRANAEDVRDGGLIPGLWRSPGEGNGNPFQYLAWEIPWTGVWWATVHGVAKESDTTKRLNNNKGLSDKKWEKGDRGPSNVMPTVIQRVKTGAKIWTQAVWFRTHSLKPCFPEILWLRSQSRVASLSVTLGIVIAVFQVDKI